MDKESLNAPVPHSNINKAIRPMKERLSVMPERIGSINIDAQNFFIDNGEGGFATKSDFLKLVYSLSIGQLVSLELVLDRMRANKDIGNSKGCKRDAQDRLYLRLLYEEDDAEHELDVHLTNYHMHTFFVLYQVHILNSSVTLEQLYDEALKTTPTNQTPD